MQQDSWTLRALIEESWTAFKPNWSALCVACLVEMFLVVVYWWLVRRVWGLGPWHTVSYQVRTAAFQIPMGFAGSWIAVGSARMSASALVGERADIRQLFVSPRGIAPYFPALALAVLVAVIPDRATHIVLEALGAPNWATGLGVWGTFIFTTVALMPFYFVTVATAMARNGSSRQLISHCFAIVREQRLRILGVMALNAGIVLAGAAVCCVGIIPAGAFVVLMNVSLYMALLRRPGCAPSL
jgi:hypothetical protein